MRWLGKVTIWQAVALGAGLIALGVGLERAVDWRAPEPVPHTFGYSSFFIAGLENVLYQLRVWLTLPVAFGVLCWVQAFRASRARDRAAPLAPPPAQDEPKRRPIARAPLAPPPDVDGDPFRSPPQPPPVRVVPPANRPQPPVASSGTDGPRILK